ncbi:MAG: hypothetical protein NTV97_33995 [Alphaproteobacteria bacterium]|nr:hypothetical protein [Alphaproteobacteria bacterium]
MRAVVFLLMLIPLASCAASIDDVRAEPVRWSNTYRVPFDTMANCLAARSIQDWSVAPQVYPREGVAYVTVAAKDSNTIMAEYVVRRQADGGSLVEWRRRKLLADLGGLETGSREAADGCARP